MNIVNEHDGKALNERDILKALAFVREAVEEEPKLNSTWEGMLRRFNQELNEIRRVYGRED